MFNRLSKTLACGIALFVAACAPEEAPLSAADYVKPENAARLSRKLESCKLVLPNDRRVEECKVAAGAKWALDTKDIRDAAIAQRDAALEAEFQGGVTVKAQDVVVRAPASVGAIEASGRVAGQLKDGPMN